MWIADASTLAEAHPVVIVAEAKPKAQDNQYTIGGCVDANNLGDATTYIHPNADAGLFMSTLPNQSKQITDGYFGYGAQVEIILPPKNGTLNLNPTSLKDDSYYDYTLSPLLGKEITIGEQHEDYFAIKVQNYGISVTIRYYVHISVLAPNEPLEYQCGEKRIWKISNFAIPTLNNLRP